MPRIDDTALLVMAEQGAKTIWYGHPGMVMEISERAGCKRGHPLNRSAAVMRALALSPKFKLRGFIRHLGRKYNVYSPKEISD